jgi:hypothetical protein
LDLVTVGARQLLLFAHALVFAFAIVAVLQEDWYVLNARRIKASRLHRKARLTLMLFGLLWLTGASLVLLDVGGDLSALAHKPKLLAKLSVVAVLTLNALLLHKIAFPLLTRPQRALRRAATVCAVLGAISTVTWLMASFIGVARLIAPAMNYTGFMVLYAVGLTLGLTVALVWVRPQLQQRMQLQAQQLHLAHAASPTAPAPLAAAEGDDEMLASAA